ncbi:MAG: fibronectin type III domain-containing protein, partial [Gammaproteobacteria bacterium]
QESRQPDFSAARVIYAGADAARVISGKPDGDWYYRVRPAGTQVTAPWSAPIRITVAHHSLGRALTFFAVGAIVFAATLGLIIHGSRQHA